MNCCSAGRRRRQPAAFTLIEALVSISIAALAGSVLLLGTTSSIQSTTEALKQTVASGMAQQLMDEVVGSRFVELVYDSDGKPLGPEAVVFGRDAGEVTRDEFDDVDDYNGYSSGSESESSPPKDPWGINLGKDDGEGGEREGSFWAPLSVSENGREAIDLFRNWRQEVDVYYVDESDLTTRLPAGQVSHYRVVEVRIIDDPPDRNARELVKLKRVVAYVPPL